MAFFVKNGSKAMYGAENVSFFSGKGGEIRARLGSNELEFMDENGESVTRIGSDGINVFFNNFLIKIFGKPVYYLSFLKNRFFNHRNIMQSVLNDL